MGRLEPQIRTGDLLEQPVEAIVNAWNRNVLPWWLLIPQGVSGAIKKRGGSSPFRALAKMGPIPLGGAVVTEAGELPFKAIIHVAGINLLWTATEASIRDSVKNAMAEVEARGLKSVAFPLIGAGTGRFGPDGALALMLEAFAPLRSDAEVIVVKFEPERGSKK